jgi:hypothetical protein
MSYFAARYLAAELLEVPEKKKSHNGTAKFLKLNFDNKQLPLPPEKRELV